VKIQRWKTRLRGARLLSINATDVSTIDDARRIIADLSVVRDGKCTLLVSSPELRDGLSNEGLPHLTLDQLNPRHFFHLPSGALDHCSNSSIVHHINRS
jgi:hypothetical protein